MESIIISSSTKEGKYREILPQIEALISSESDCIANLANVAAVLRETFGFYWVGFYIVKDDQLVLGPFQGPLACTRINYGKGVCGTAWAKAQTILVPDVDKFPGHIACSSASRSEIVVPVFSCITAKVVAVLDIDSDQLNDFDALDAKYLEQLSTMLSNYFA